MVRFPHPTMKGKLSINFNEVLTWLTTFRSESIENMSMEFLSGPDTHQQARAKAIFGHFLYVIIATKDNGWKHDAYEYRIIPSILRSELRLEVFETGTVEMKSAEAGVAEAVEDIVIKK